MFALVRHDVNSGSGALVTIMVGPDVIWISHAQYPWKACRLSPEPAWCFLTFDLFLELMMKYWLLKSEPSVFGIENLKNRPDGTEHWDGVRNYQARNFMRDEMKCGDLAFFYHSNCKVPGIVGIVEIVREAYPDFTAFDPEDDHYDPKSSRDLPRWYMVDVRFKREFSRTISLNELKECAELQEMALLRRGNRLSVMPVTRTQWQFILSLT